jgi:uncharacterized protein (TIGR03086 family)
MTEIADRYRKASAQFLARAEQVPADAWDNPAPCEGWVARDVVRHLVEWPPMLFFERWDIPQPETPSVDDDPVAAWRAIDEAFKRTLDDPAIAQTVVDDLPMGSMSFEDAVAMILTDDVFLHTWDLARATGLDETLDADEVHRMYVGMLPFDEVLRSSGHYGPRVEVPDDADEQTKLLAFIGRQV